MFALFCEVREFLEDFFRVLELRISEDYFFIFRNVIIKEDFENFFYIFFVKL